MKLKIKGGASVDALALTFARVVVLLISMATYKLMASGFSIEEYGVYASAMLVVTTVVSLSILGLTDAVNYFYLRDPDLEKGKVYVHTIFALQTIVGGAAAIAILLFSNQIADYFGNPAVAPLTPWIALIPLLTNVTNMLQVLFVAARKVKALVIRNFVVAVFKIAAVAVACLALKDITAVLAATFILDLGVVVYMLAYCRKYIFSVRLFRAKLGLTKEILTYSVPMAACIFTNSMTKNLDKLVVGALGTPEDLGVYSVASKELPFDIFTSAFLVVLIPYLTRYIASCDFKKAADIFSKYLQLAYSVMFIVAGGALVCADEFICILYDKQYLIGVNVFCLFLLVDIIKFATATNIFSVSNKTKQLLVYSGSALALNAALSVLLFKAVGLIGPALATVIATTWLACALMRGNARLLRTSVWSLLNGGLLLRMTGECLLFGALAYWVKTALADKLYVFPLFIIVYGVYVAPLFLINYKRILSLVRAINGAKMA